MGGRGPTFHSILQGAHWSLALSRVEGQRQTHEGEEEEGGSRGGWPSVPQEEGVAGKEGAAQTAWLEPPSRRPLSHHWSQSVSSTVRAVLEWLQIHPDTFFQCVIQTIRIILNLLPNSSLLPPNNLCFLCFRLYFLNEAFTYHNFHTEKNTEHFAYMATHRNYHSALDFSFH